MISNDIVAIDSPSYVSLKSLSDRTQHQRPSLTCSQHRAEDASSASSHPSSVSVETRLGRLALPSQHLSDTSESTTSSPASDPMPASVPTPLHISSPTQKRKSTDADLRLSHDAKRCRAEFVLRDAEKEICQLTLEDSHWGRVCRHDLGSNSGPFFVGRCSDFWIKSQCVGTAEVVGAGVNARQDVPAKLARYVNHHEFVLLKLEMMDTPRGNIDLGEADFGDHESGDDASPDPSNDFNWEGFLDFDHDDDSPFGGAGADSSDPASGGNPHWSAHDTCAFNSLDNQEHDQIVPAAVVTAGDEADHLIRPCDVECLENTTQTLPNLVESFSSGGVATEMELPLMETWRTLWFVSKSSALTDLQRERALLYLVYL